MYFTEGWIVNASSESSQIRVNLIVLSLLIISFCFYFFFFFILQVMTFKLMNDTSKLLIFDPPPEQLVLHYVFWPFYSLADYLRIFSGASLNLCKPGCTTLTCEQRFFSVMALAFIMTTTLTTSCRKESSVRRVGCIWVEKNVQYWITQVYRGSSIGFSGFRISLIWSSGFGI